MRQTLKTPHYRIDDPHSGLAVEFVSESAPMALAPRIHARLTRPERATIFASFEHAADCFSRYLRGQTLEINRIDGVAA